MALHVLLDAHLQKVVGTAGYSVSGATATVSASLDSRQLQELADVAFQLKHDLKIVTGAVKVIPR